MTADSTVAEIEAAGGTALGLEVDVRDHEAGAAMVARVVATWGQVDVLVTNAGGGRGRPMDTKASTLDPALLRLVVELNLFGTAYTVNMVAPVMKERRSGIDHNGEFGRRDRTISGRRLCPLRGQAV